MDSGLENPSVGGGPLFEEGLGGAESPVACGESSSAGSGDEPGLEIIEKRLFAECGMLKFRVQYVFVTL